MRVSLIIRSKDEADRLRLALTSLTRQTEHPEIIIVNDGSCDHTRSVISEREQSLPPFKVIHHAAPRGRSGAANAGASIATGDILLFLDGDNLADPQLVARHSSAHSANAGLIIGRGETWNLRCTRFLLDPERGTARPGHEFRLAQLSPAEAARLRVTRRDIVENFSSIERRAAPGIYPGAGPRRLYELERQALCFHPDCGVLWAAAAGCNLSVPRDLFSRCGGFNEEIDINEHRELALRLCRSGARMSFVEGARTYHMTHRSGWRDPLEEVAWEEVFVRVHADPAVRLLAVFWAGLTDSGRVPREARINSLPELEAVAKAAKSDEIETLRRLAGCKAVSGSAASRAVGA
ncbi:MAG: glycosyltransferase family 2 protein [Xanthobacteraceae bacterium]